MTTAHDLRDLNDDDLRRRELDLDDQIFRMRIQKSMGQLDVPQKIRDLRRDLARVKTVLRERSLSARGKAASGGTQAGAGAGEAGRARRPSDLKG